MLGTLIRIKRYSYVKYAQIQNIFLATLGQQYFYFDKVNISMGEQIVQIMIKEIFV